MSSNVKQRSYKATGINLKAMPMGESDRLVTVLTKEYGLVRAIAPGARKHKSRLAGRSGLFVVNEALFTKGKSLDKMVQAETQRSFPGLSTDLSKLTASQYLAELALAQALTEQPQPDLYYLLLEHLGRIESAAKSNVLPCLAQATFHMLALAGVAPEVFRCCLSRAPLTVELGNPEWQVGFSVSSGGAIDLAEVSRLEGDRMQEIEHIEKDWQAQRERDRHNIHLTTEEAIEPNAGRVKEASAAYNNPISTHNAQKKWKAGLHAKVTKEINRNLGIVGYLSGAELALMQQLSKPELLMTSPIAPVVRTARSASTQTATQVDPHLDSKSGTIRSSKLPTDSFSATATPHLMWRHIEKFLRQYAQYQFDRPIKSAALIDTCFTPPTHAARV